MCWLASQHAARQETLVPPVALGCVVAVPVGDAGPGTAMQTGPGDATLSTQDKTQRLAATCRRRACWRWSRTQVQDFNSQGREASMMMVGMLQKLEELESPLDAPSEQLGLRSVARRSAVSCCFQCCIGVLTGSTALHITQSVRSLSFDLQPASTVKTRSRSCRMLCLPPRVHCNCNKHSRGTKHTDKDSKSA